jgi:hypothetical protein
MFVAPVLQTVHGLAAHTTREERGITRRAGAAARLGTRLRQLRRDVPRTSSPSIGQNLFYPQ